MAVAVICTAMFTILTMCDQYLSLIIPATMYKENLRCIPLRHVRCSYIIIFTVLLRKHFEPTDFHGYGSYRRQYPVCRRFQDRLVRRQGKEGPLRCGSSGRSTRNRYEGSVSKGEAEWFLKELICAKEASENAYSCFSAALASQLWKFGRKITFLP